jgi:hypothetical protein
MIKCLAFSYFPSLSILSVGFYVVFQNKEAVPHKLIENFLIKPPLAKLSWRCSGEFSL